MASYLSAPEQDQIRGLWAAAPDALRSKIAARATELLGRRVTVDQVRHYRPSDQGRRYTPSPTEVVRRPRPETVPSRKGLPYDSPLEVLILEARTVSRRLGIRRRKGAA